MKFLLTSSSYGGEKVNENNIKLFINDFMSNVAFLYNIHKYIESSGFAIVINNDVYNNDYFFSDTLTKKAIANYIEDEEALGLYIDMFTSHQDIIPAYPYSGEELGNTTCGEAFENFSYGNSLEDDELGLISFSSEGKYNTTHFNINGERYFHVPPLAFKKDLSFLNNIRDFYFYFFDNFNIIRDDRLKFDYFDNYYFTYYFFNYNDNFNKISKVLSGDLTHRLNFHPVIGDFFAKINGYNVDESLSKKCSKGDVKRLIYKNKNKHISLDFQHLEFEKHEPSGKHIGCIRMYKGDEGDERIKKLTRHEPDHNLTFS